MNNLQNDIIKVRAKNLLREALETNDKQLSNKLIYDAIEIVRTIVNYGDEERPREPSNS